MTLLQSAIKELPSRHPFIAEVFYFSTVASTNDEAIRKGKVGAKNGTLIVSDTQSAGRGRMGRHWDSPKGKGLYFSLLLRPKLKTTSAPLITLATGLGMARALREMGIFNLLIKWPNDIWAEKKKLGGILTEMFNSGSEVDFVVVGVGLNVSTETKDFTPELRTTAASLQQTTKKKWDREEVLDKILPRIKEEIDNLVHKGSIPLINSWIKESGMIGKKVEISEQGGQVQGVVKGLAPDGQLLVESETGAIHSIISGDITVCY